MEQLSLNLSDDFRQATHQHKVLFHHFYKCDRDNLDALALYWCDTFNKWCESTYTNRQIIHNSGYVRINNE